MKNSIALKLKQVPEGYLVIGVDPHKKKHAIVVMTQDLMLRTRFKVPNSKQGFDGVLQRVHEQMLSSNCRGAIFAIESASHYWRNLCYYLDRNGVPFRLINQFTLKRQREGQELNRKKNDFTDAAVAARLLCHGEYTQTKLLPGPYAELRAADSHRLRLTQDRSRSVNQLKGLLDGIFPEFTEVFKDPCGQTALSVLVTCPVPATIARLTPQEFVQRVRVAHQGRLMVGKLHDLHRLSHDSIGIPDGSASVCCEMAFLACKIRFLDQHLRLLQKTLVGLADQTDEAKYLLSIPGISYLTVAGILAQTGPFSNYQCAKQLIKMAGTNPTEAESAGKRSHRSPMSKKGRGALRYELWNGVISLLRHNQEFRDWVKRLTERPAHLHPLQKMEAIGAAANRLLRLGFALVKNKSFYRLAQLASI